MCTCLCVCYSTSHLSQGRRNRVGATGARAPLFCCSFVPYRPCLRANAAATTFMRTLRTYVHVASRAGGVAPHAQFAEGLHSSAFHYNITKIPDPLLLRQPAPLSHPFLPLHSARPTT